MKTNTDLTPLEDFNRKSFILLNRMELIFKAYQSFHKISCSEMYSDSVELFLQKRDSSKSPNVKSYWNNKLLNLFSEAEKLLSLLNPMDELYFEMTRSEIEEILTQMKLKYGLLSHVKTENERYFQERDEYFNKELSKLN